MSKCFCSFSSWWMLLLIPASSSSGKWCSLDYRQTWTMFWTWAYRVWLRIRVDHNFHTCCLYMLGLKSWEYSWPSDHSWSRLFGAVHDDLRAEFRSVYLRLLEWLQTFFVKECESLESPTEQSVQCTKGNSKGITWLVSSLYTLLQWTYSEYSVFLHFLLQM